MLSFKTCEHFRTVIFSTLVPLPTMCFAFARHIPMVTPVTTGEIGLSRIVATFLVTYALSLRPPFTSLARKGDLSVALRKERVFEVKYCGSHLIALDTVDSLSTPNGGNFRNQICPLALGLGMRRKISQIAVGVCFRKIQRDKLIDKLSSLVFEAELRETIQFGLQGLRVGLEQFHVRRAVGGIEYRISRCRCRWGRINLHGGIETRLQRRLLWFAVGAFAFLSHICG
mmetsp:Transcript_14513/g.36466  ORF Transcript_14513/g.36466 Transcript_14513/m.36466 type:complete len:228 (+) Transcript_14513:561-1244(+)